jgi:hypothetical protein
MKQVAASAHQAIVHNPSQCPLESPIDYHDPP